jgi:hypothetical protein
VLLGRTWPGDELASHVRNLIATEREPHPVGEWLLFLGRTAANDVAGAAGTVGVRDPCRRAAASGAVDSGGSRLGVLAPAAGPLRAGPGPAVACPRNGPGRAGRCMRAGLPPGAVPTPARPSPG